MSQSFARGFVWTFAVIIVCFGIAAALKACELANDSTEVTPVLEATTPESTGPAESEEKTVVELPDTSGVKLTEEE